MLLANLSLNPCTAEIHFLTGKYKGHKYKRWHLNCIPCATGTSFKVSVWVRDSHLFIVKQMQEFLLPGWNQQQLWHWVNQAIRPSAHWGLSQHILQNVLVISDIKLSISFWYISMLLTSQRPSLPFPKVGSSKNLQEGNNWESIISHRGQIWDGWKIKHPPRERQSPLCIKC